jgi:septal ring factor EnvC (AmiA/AmiB activator)
MSRTSAEIAAELAAANRQVSAWRQKATRLAMELEAAEQAERIAAAHAASEVETGNGKAHSDSRRGGPLDAGGTKRDEFRVGHPEPARALSGRPETEEGYRNP